MKYITKTKLVFPLIILVFGLIVCLLFDFYQDSRRFLTVAGFLGISYGAIEFPRLLAIRYKSNDFTKYVTIYLGSAEKDSRPLFSTVLFYSRIQLFFKE